MEFAEFYQATSPRTLRYAYGLTGDLAQAQDVVQEAYVRAWQRWRRVGGYDDTEAWLRLVVSRLVFDWWRHLRVRRATPLPPPGVVDGPTEESVLIAAALRKLPDGQRQALALHYLLDMPVARIAVELDVSEGTVKSWLSRGRDRLAVLLQDQPAADLPTAESVAAAGRRRRRTRVGVVTAAGVAVLVAIWLATAVLGRHQSMPPTPAVRPTASPLAFAPLRRTGAVTLPPAADRTVAIQDGRAVVASSGPAGVQLAAVDLATARAAWPPVTVAAGAAGWRLVTRPDALAVVGQNTTFVLDPATGHVRWQRAVVTTPDDVLFFPGVVIFTAADRLLGVDVTTGRQLWTLPRPTWRAFGAILPGDLALPDTGATTTDTRYNGDLLYAFDSTTLTEYAVTSGTSTGRHWTNLQPAVGLQVYEGTLYVLGPHGVTLVDLADDHRSAVPLGGPVRWLAPCGPQDICALATAPEGGAADVVALDGNRVDWRSRTVSEAETIAPYGRGLRVFCYAGPGTVLVDEHGRQTSHWPVGDVVERLDATNLLVVAKSGELTGITEDGRQTPLGTVGPGASVAGAGPFVAAATGSELVIYRIA